MFFASGKRVLLSSYFIAVMFFILLSSLSYFMCFVIVLLYWLCTLYFLILKSSPLMCNMFLEWIILRAQRSLISRQELGRSTILSSLHRIFCWQTWLV